MNKWQRSASVGRAGEFLALSRLSLAGNECILVQNPIDDAFIKTINGNLLTVQVKTCAKQYHSQYNFFTKFGKTKKRSDIFAFVALDIEKILFCRGDNKLIMDSTTRFKSGSFLNEVKKMEIVLKRFNKS